MQFQKNIQPKIGGRNNTSHCRPTHSSTAVSSYRHH